MKSEVLLYIWKQFLHNAWGTASGYISTPQKGAGGDPTAHACHYWTQSQSARCVGRNLLGSCSNLLIWPHLRALVRSIYRPTTNEHASNRHIQGCSGGWSCLNSVYLSFIWPLQYWSHSTDVAVEEVSHFTAPAWCNAAAVLLLPPIIGTVWSNSAVRM